MLALMLPAIHHARDAARSVDCKNRLKQMMISLHVYHDSHETFPPGYVAIMGIKGDTRENGWAWTAFLLPYLEQGPLFSSIDFESGLSTATPTDANNGSFGTTATSNVSLVSTRINMLTCPVDTAPPTVPRNDPVLGAVDYATTSYSGMTGIHWMQLPCATIVLKPGEEIPELTATPCRPSEGVFYVNSRSRFLDIIDGTSSTIGVGEVSWRFDHPEGSPSRPYKNVAGGSQWARVSDPSASEHVLTATEPGINHPDQQGYSPGLSSNHLGGAHVGMIDGSVRYVSELIESNPQAPYGLLQHLSTIRGHEPVIDEF